MPTKYERKSIEKLREFAKEIVIPKEVCLSDSDNMFILESIAKLPGIKKYWGIPSDCYKRVVDISLKDMGLMSYCKDVLGYHAESRDLSHKVQDSIWDPNEGMVPTRFKNYDIIVCRILPYLYNDYDMLASIFALINKTGESRVLFIMPIIEGLEMVLRYYPTNEFIKLCGAHGLEFVEGKEDPNYPGMGLKYTAFKPMGCCKMDRKWRQKDEC